MKEIPDHIDDILESSQDEDSEDTAIVNWGRRRGDRQNSPSIVATTESEAVPAVIVTERELLKLRADRVGLFTLSYTEMEHSLTLFHNMPGISMEIEGP